MKANYVHMVTTKSRCPNCNALVDLLQHINPTKEPSFYICWACMAIYEIGKGEVPLVKAKDDL